MKHKVKPRGEGEGGVVNRDAGEVVNSPVTPQRREAEKETFPPSPPIEKKGKARNRFGVNQGTKSGAGGRATRTCAWGYPTANRREAAVRWDLVREALFVFQGNEDNRKLWGWYSRRLGVDRFRELMLQQLSENCSDGAPRNPAAAFHVKLRRALAVLRETKGGRA